MFPNRVFMVINVLVYSAGWPFLFGTVEVPSVCLSWMELKGSCKLSSHLCHELTAESASDSPYLHYPAQKP